MARSANKRTDVDPVHIRAILPLLFWIYASYADRPSRQAVQRCLTSICKKKNAVYLAPLVTAMRQESQSYKQCVCLGRVVQPFDGQHRGDPPLGRVWPSRYPQQCRCAREMPSAFLEKEHGTFGPSQLPPWPQEALCRCARPREGD